MSRGRPVKKDKAVFKKISVYERTYDDIKIISKKKKKPVCVIVEELVDNNK